MVGVVGPRQAGQNIWESATEEFAGHTANKSDKVAYKVALEVFDLIS
jgi:hypothetical protein